MGGKGSGGHNRKAPLPEPEEDRDPWERRSDETLPAWEAFVVYRDLGLRRSQRKTCDALAKNRTTVQQWAAKYDWKRRCEAWDAEIDRKRREEEIEGVRKMRRRHIEAAEQLQDVGIAKVKDLKTKKERAKMSATEAVRFIREGVNIERVARGEPEDVLEARVTGASDAETNRALSKLAKALGVSMDDLAEDPDPEE